MTIINFLKKSKTQDHTKMIDLMYQIFFSRKAERAAVNQWSKFLDDGLNYKDFFEKLWKSDEFSTKVEQNKYFKKPIGKVAALENTSSNLISDEMLEAIFEKLTNERDLLLQISSIRSLIAQWRYRDLDGPNTVKLYDKPDAKGIIENTITYNELSLRSSVGFDRGATVIAPLNSIGWVQDNIKSLKVLTIGARSEVEYFTLLAAGFEAANITNVDLISYSPFIEIGDMHNLKYKDNSFDIVVISCVLPYSNDQQKAVNEILRVIKNDGIVAYSDVYVPENSTHVRPDIHVKGKTLACCEEVQNLFQPHVGDTYFKTDPRPPYDNPITSRLVVLFGINKK